MMLTSMAGNGAQDGILRRAKGLLRAGCMLFAAIGVWGGAAAADQAKADWADSAWRFVTERTYSPATHLIYDYLVGDTPDAHVRYLPSPEDIRQNFPCPTGWGTGMEDSVLNGSPFLMAAMRRHDVTGDGESLKVARLIFDGLCRCAEVSPTRGYLARSISPVDCKSHYANSSRDQYTMFVYALWRYWGWPKSTPEEKARVARILVDIARFAERCVTPENDFCLLREDGGPSFVCKMWTATPCVAKERISGGGAFDDYGKIFPHEILRLPEIYAAAHAVSGDRHWREKELELADQGIEMSFGRQEGRMHAYALYQMQTSIRLLWELETDSARRARYLELLKLVVKLTGQVPPRVRKLRDELKGDFTASPVEWRRRRFVYLPMEWSGGPPAPVGGMRYLVPQSEPGNAFSKVHLSLREAAEAVLIAQLCPDMEVPKDWLDLMDSLFASVDYGRLHISGAPAHALLAYWQARHSAGRQ